MTTERKIRSLSTSQTLFGYLFIFPAILGILLFVAGPMIYSLYLSFTDWNILSPAQWVGFGNYHRIFAEDELFYKSLQVTFYYAILTIVCTLAISFIVALLLNVNMRGQSLFRVIFYLPSIVPVIAGSVLWVWLYDTDFGLLNYLLGEIGISKQLWINGEGSAIPALTLASMWGTGNVILIFLAGLQDVPKHLHEAVEIDGGNGWHKLKSVTIPLMSPTIFFNFLMGFVGAFTGFTQSYAMTNGGPNYATLMYVFNIYREGFRNQSMGYACALAWVLFIIMVILTYLIFKTSKGWVHYEGEGDR